MKSTSTHYTTLSSPRTHSFKLNNLSSLHSSMDKPLFQHPLPKSTRFAALLLLTTLLLYDPLPKSNIPIVPLQSQKYTSVTIILTRADWRMGWDGIAFEFDWKHVIVLS